MDTPRYRAPRSVTSAQPTSPNMRSPDRRGLSTTSAARMRSILDAVLIAATYLSCRSQWPLSVALSVAAEGFLQPPRAALGAHLRVDHERHPPVPRQPVADRAQVRRFPNGHPHATVAG